MKIKSLFTTLAILCSRSILSAQDVQLHVNTEWEECSFQLDPSLTQESWHKFTREAGMVVYFRPVINAEPLGAGRFQFDLLQWNTGIDETNDAWNNTFVHPDSAHYLVGGEILGFPGLSLRAGLTDKIDAGIYWTLRPGANYGIIGGQLQYNFIHDTSTNWALSSRLNFNSLYGPDDLNLMVYGLDALASKKFNVFGDWASVTPYAGVSGYISHAHEKTEAVVLEDENIGGLQGMLGLNANIYFLELGAEYNFANVITYSYKLGFNFKF